MTRSAGGRSLEERAVALLASGVAPSKVAEICDVDPSRISQLMDSSVFKEKLSEAKFDQATKYTSIDQKLNALEETVIDGLTETIGMVLDPLKLVRVLQVVNGAKRRGTQLLGDGLDHVPIVSLTLPTKIVNNFVVNQVNQVVQAGGEDLITIQPSQMKELLNEQKSRIANEQTNTKISAALKARFNREDPESV